MSPFLSKSQAKFMFSKHPQIAKEMASKTPSIKALPEHVKKMSKTRMRKRTRKGQK